MKKGFKKYFVPHKENEYKPHFLRKASVLGVAVFVGFLFVGAAATQQYITTSQNFGAVISSALVDLTNADRAKSDLRTLAVNPALEQAARFKAEDMAEKGYFAHESPDGKDPWHWFQEAGYSFVYAGENLAVDFSDSVAVENAWMNSTGHRANILHSQFTEIGIATARGIYNGRETTFVVQMFGTPATVQPTTDNIQPTTDNVSADPAEGETQTSETVAGAETSTPNELKTVAVDNTFIAVENTRASSAEEVRAQTRDYAAWYEVVITSPHTTLKYIYTILAGLVLLALLLLICVEIRKQHILHILYGVALLVFILALLYTGKAFVFPEVLIL